MLTIRLLLYAPRAEPAEEDVARGLHEVLTGDHAFSLLDASASAPVAAAAIAFAS